MRDAHGGEDGVAMRGKGKGVETARGVRGKKGWPAAQGGEPRRLARGGAAGSGREEDGGDGRGWIPTAGLQIGKTRCLRLSCRGAHRGLDAWRRVKGEGVDDGARFPAAVHGHFAIGKRRCRLCFRAVVARREEALALRL